MSKNISWICVNFPFWALLVFFAGNVLSQEGEWKTFNTNDGLANNDVRAIAVDGDFIWFGTYGSGLNRFQKSIESTPTAWMTFTTTNGLISNFVRAVAIDGDEVWIGTDHGINRYRKSTQTWETARMLNCITSIGVDVDDLWFGTAGSGVHRYEKSTGRWSVLDSTNSQLPRNAITAIAVDGDLLWFGTPAGASRYRQSTGEMQNFRAALNGLASSAINAISVDGDKVWFGHAPGTLNGGAFTITEVNINPPTSCPPKFLLAILNVKFSGGPNPSISGYNTSSNQWQNFEVCEPGPDVLRREKNCFPVQAAAARTDEVWFGTVSKGAYRYNKTSGALANFNSTNSGLAGDLVWTIAFDGNDIWMGTFGHGVSRYRPPTELWKCYRKVDGLVDESVESISIFGDEVWFGTLRGVSRLQISTGKWTNFSVANTGAVLAIGADTNEIWVGPVLRRYDKLANTWSRVDSTESPLGNSSIVSIVIDNAYIWFGVNDGKIGRYHKATNNWMIFDSTQTKLYGAIYSIDIVGNEVWVADRRTGVSRYDKATNRWNRYTTSNSGLVNNTVTAVGIDGDYVWFSTFGGSGISRYHKPSNTWVTFNAANTGQTPFFNNLWTLAVDGDFVWFGSNSRGVFRYEKPTGQWENFSTLNNRLPANRVYDIEAKGRYVWFAVFDTDPFNSSNRTGGVCRYGDVSPPELLHSPIAGEKPSLQNVTILASIDDNVAVKSAAVYYRLAGTMDYKSNPLQPFSGDTWFGEIPARDVTLGILEYYLSATDGRNNATHPFSSASNAPHHFKVYDSVPPIASPSISSQSGFLTDSTALNVNIIVNGTGSMPSIKRLAMVGYQDFSAVRAIDTVAVSFIDSSVVRSNHTLTVTGRIDLILTNENIVAIKSMVVAIDEGHDENGNPLFTRGFSNSLIRFAGAINVNAEEGKTLLDNTRRAKLYLPPRALRRDAFVRFVATTEPGNDGVATIGTSFLLEPTDIELVKPGILTISLSPEDWAKIQNKNQVGIHHLQRMGTDSLWQSLKIGGLIDEEQRAVTTAITQFGYYAVIAGDFKLGQQATSISKLEALPRAFSPRGSKREPQTSITFALGKPSSVTIKVFNPAGRLKRILADHEMMPEGTHVKIWNGRDQENQIVASGIYVVCLEVAGEILTRTVMVINN